ncbi:MAG: Gfo/Idh/MocA family oxidoreductase [Pirellulales bacterium]
MSSNPTQARRNFLKTTAAGAAATTFAANRAMAEVGVRPAGSDKIKIGLIGCGGRGTGAAIDALSAGDDIELVAIGDTFKDRADGALASIQGSASVADRVKVAPDHVFTDFDNYKHVTDAADVVLLATPPYFRPMHLAYAIEQGKHVFCEKPVAVDGPGIRSILETSKQAKEKGLSLVSGLCWRYHPAKQATFEQVHGGAIGDIVAMQCNYNVGGLWHRGDNPDWSRMEYQIRNWLYFTWLSGDFIAEQHIHSLDKMAWAMNDEPPVKVTGMGGRQTRTDAQYGDAYDHFSSCFEYANGVRVFSYCRQQNGCSNEVNDYIMGSEGVVDVMAHRITVDGEKKWDYRGKGGNMYRLEHEALFDSIRKGAALNNGEYMAKSTLMAIMARDSAYTGKTITWDEALNSERQLGPATLAWGEAPEVKVAMPGLA